MISHRKYGGDASIHTQTDGNTNNPSLPAPCEASGRRPTGGQKLPFEASLRPKVIGIFGPPMNSITLLPGGREGKKKEDREGYGIKREMALNSRWEEGNEGNREAD